MNQLNIQILFKDGRLKMGTLNKNWYIKHDKLELYNSILYVTKFLDEYDNVSFRERIFYIQNYLNNAVICPYCNCNKVTFNKNELKFNIKCNQLECKRKGTSDVTSRINRLRSDEHKKIIANKISKKLKGRPLSDDTKRKLSISHIGKVQSEDTIKKRIDARKNNGKPWHSEESKSKISKKNKEVWNSPNYIQKRQQMFTDEVRKKISNKIKNKILDGTFTPCITNTWTNWDSWVNVNGKLKKFRSNWEAVYWLLNQHLKYEKLRIPYMYENKQRIYITDFIDEKNKIVYEIKPKSQIENSKNKSKIKELKKWCELNNWKFIIISDEWYLNNANKIDYQIHPQLKKSMNQFIWE